MITVDLIIEVDAEDAIPSEKDFETWVNVVAAALPEKIAPACAEISIAIVDEAQSAALNETYRHKKGPTNVLSFAYETMPGIAQTSLGDLIICASVMKTEASAQQIPLIAHWAHLTVHGTLHLLGYDHMVDAEATVMESLETTLLQSLGFEDPYA